MKVKTKKKSNFFEIYIVKKLKEISDKKFTNDAKYQLNSVLCSISKIISDIAFNLTVISKKKTISLKELTNSINIVFTTELSEDIIAKYNLVLENFDASNNVYSNRNVKAGIIFPPSILEKFLRGFGYKKVMVTGEVPVALATAIEYVLFVLLNLSCQNVGINKKITVDDLDNVVEEDKCFKKIFKKYNISFISSQKFKPFTYSYNKEQKYIIKQFTNNRFSQDIKHVFPKFCFERIIRNIIKDKYNIEIKISKETFIVLQFYIESYIIDLLHDCYFAALHAKRIKLLPMDINFILGIKYKNINNYLEIKTLKENVFDENT